MSPLNAEWEKWQDQLEALKLDDLVAPEDNTDLNASTSVHGLLKKLDNDAAHAMLGTGAWGHPVNLDIGARAYHNTTQAIPNASDTILALNSENFDTDTIHDLVTNNSRLTCNTAGKYVITCYILMAAQVGSYTAVGALLRNGAVIAAFQVATGGNAGAYINITTVYSLAATNYIQCRVYHTFGSDLNCTGVNLGMLKVA